MSVGLGRDDLVGLPRDHDHELLAEGQVLRGAKFLALLIIRVIPESHCPSE